MRKFTRIGLASLDAAGNAMDTWFPFPREVSTDYPCASVVMTDGGADDEVVDLLWSLAGFDPVRSVRRVVVRVTTDIDVPPRDIHDAYLRLHLLSWRLVAPREPNLDGLLGLLYHDVAWTSLGPCPSSSLGDVRLRALQAGHHLVVRGVFSLPPMLDYVALPDVRIGDATRVLLGAHLAAGTTVTPEGFCGFNAGSLGACMIEGRVSAGVVLHEGSHIGGGASLMGRVSGGNNRVVTIGARCLVGANAGVGIALGDDCVVEAGCYVTAGLPVTLADGRVVKARELADRPGLTFRRDSVTGRVEVVERARPWGALNPHMHPGR